MSATSAICAEPVTVMPFFPRSLSPPETNHNPKKIPKETNNELKKIEIKTKRDFIFLLYRLDLDGFLLANLQWTRNNGITTKNAVIFPISPVMPVLNSV